MSKCMIARRTHRIRAQNTSQTRRCCRSRQDTPQTGTRDSQQRSQWRMPHPCTLRRTHTVCCHRLHKPSEFAKQCSVTITTLADKSSYDDVGLQLARVMVSVSVLKTKAVKMAAEIVPLGRPARASTVNARCNCDKSNKTCKTL